MHRHINDCVQFTTKMSKVSFLLTYFEYSQRNRLIYEIKMNFIEDLFTGDI